MTTSDVVQAIDRHWQENDKGHRRHLGASQIGKACERALVYSFRHAVTETNEGRMLRLFSRGHLEEPRFFSYLRQVGIEVQEFSERLVLNHHFSSYDTVPWDREPNPDDIMDNWSDVSEDERHLAAASLGSVHLRQWGFKTHGGHFAGSTDGRGIARQRAFEGLPIGESFLIECKTHNTKSFLELERVAEECRAGESAVQKTKPMHYDQMQVYMHKMELPRTLYMAVNKNDDSLYTEVVPYHRETAEALLAKAQRVILARQLPNRISAHPSWYGCKFCEYKGPCHYGHALEKHCRTCRHVVPVDDARFHCGRWNTLIPLDVESKGCDNWETITD